MTQWIWVKCEAGMSGTVWVPIGFPDGGCTESGQWGFRFKPGLEVRVLGQGRCDGLFLGVGGGPAPTV